MISDKTHQVLMKLEKPLVIEIMEDALDLMQQYNGRTIQFCVEEALKQKGYSSE